MNLVQKLIYQTFPGYRLLFSQEFNNFPPIQAGMVIPKWKFRDEDLAAGVNNLSKTREVSLIYLSWRPRPWTFSHGLGNWLPGGQFCLADVFWLTNAVVTFFKISEPLSQVRSPQFSQPLSRAPQARSTHLCNLPGPYRHLNLWPSGPGDDRQVSNRYQNKLLLNFSLSVFMYLYPKAERGDEG